MDLAEVRKASLKSQAHAWFTVTMLKPQARLIHCHNAKTTSTSLIHCHNAKTTSTCLIHCHNTKSTRTCLIHCHNAQCTMPHVLEPAIYIQQAINTDLDQLVSVMCKVNCYILWVNNCHSQNWQLKCREKVWENNEDKWIGRLKLEEWRNSWQWAKHA